MREARMSARTAKVLWIESEPLSGGSRSQVEFPADLGPFFGASARAKVGDELEIGVDYAGVEFGAKKMDFHQNLVWRLNLPTKPQGIGDYAGAVLVFSKTAKPSRFSLWVLDPRSTVLKRLRAKSKMGGLIGYTTRVGGSKRLHGYF
jgi:hypothetical protein